MSKLETGLHYPLKLDALPPDWRVGYVGDFAEEIQPGFASGKHNKEGAGIPHIRPYNIDRQGKLDLTEIKSVAPDSDTKRLRTDDVLFNNTNSPELIGKTAVIALAGDWGFSNHMTRIRFKDEVAPKFAVYQLHFLWMTGYYLHNCVKHVNQASISSKTLANAVPFVAPPLDQQKRIVAEIEKQFSRLDEAVANLKRVKANLKRYKAAVLKAAVEGRLVETEAELARRANVEAASRRLDQRQDAAATYETGEQLLQRILETRRSQWKGKGKYKEPTAPDITGLPKLPEGWAWTNFESVADRVTVGHVGSMKNEYIDEGIPFLRSQNVRPNRFDPEGIKFISEKFHGQLAKSTLHPGDIVVVRSGSVGVSCVIPAHLTEANCSDLVIIKAPHAVLPNYGAYYMNSVVETRVAAGKVGVALTHFNTQSVAKLPLPIPPLAEQNRIVIEVDRRLSVVDETETLVDENLARAEFLRHIILQEAFSGRLAVGKWHNFSNVIHPPN